MTLWKLPPKIKIYEALWAVADERIHMQWFFANEATCYSSSGNKFYTVKYDPDQRAIMVNDKWSYRNNYLGYPGIAFLMIKGILTYDPEYAFALKDIPRKDINQQFKNDFDKTADSIHQKLQDKGISVEGFLEEVDAIYAQIEALHLHLLWPKMKPPTWY